MSERALNKKLMCLLECMCQSRPQCESCCTCSELRDGEARNRGLIDSGKILHSLAFRRLQGKRQVLGVDQGDFHRTRLTHSSEVASISRTIAEVFIKQLAPIDKSKQLSWQQKLRSSIQKKEEEANFKLLSEYILHDHQKNFLDSLRAISMAHDIGHPPFGHGGEAVLNYLMRHSGGFEGNAQNIHLIAKLDKLNLSRQTLLGIIKYPVMLKIAEIDPQDKNKKFIDPDVDNPHIGIDCYSKTIKDKKSNIIKGFYKEDEDIIKWALRFNGNESDLKKFQKKYLENLNERCLAKSFSCSIMDIADDISNAINDLEDIINLKLITKATLKDHLEKKENIIIRFLKPFYDQTKLVTLNTIIDTFFDDEKHVRKTHVGSFIHALTQSIELHRNEGDFDNPLLQYRIVLNKDAHSIVTCLKKIVMDEIIKSQEIQVIEYGGARAIIDVFNAIEKNTNLLPKKEQGEIKNVTLAEKKRVICNYIAGMTDAYLLNLHSKLSGANPGSVFERL